MFRLSKLVFFFALCFAQLVGGSAVHGQTASKVNPPPSIAVSISIDRDSVTQGQTPWAILTVKNLTERELPIHDWAVRVHIEGQNGEPPATLIQRLMTGKLQPGDQAIRADEQWLWEIPPGESSSHKYKLSYFYDLNAPGKYVVYLEVLDPVSQKSLRTNTAKFEIQASKQ